MVLLSDADAILSEPSTVNYLVDETNVAVCLEAGLQEMIKVCKADSSRDPIKVLASWLKQHNPATNQSMAQELNAMRAAYDARAAAAAARAARQQIENDARVAAAEGGYEYVPSTELPELAITVGEGGDVHLQLSKQSANGFSWK